MSELMEPEPTLKCPVCGRMVYRFWSVTTFKTAEQMASAFGIEDLPTTTDEAPTTVGACSRACCDKLETLARK